MLGNLPDTEKRKHVAQGEVPRISLSSALTERVLDLIRGEGLASGDRLPSTRELSQRFAVTTPTLREALRGLEATGAIEFRHGSGIYVGPGLNRVVLPNPNVGHLRGGQMLQLLDARLLIEPPVAALAAQYAAPDQRAGLEAILDQASRQLGGHDELLRTSTMSFHRAVARSAGNMVLSEVVDCLLTVHAPEQQEILEIFDDRQRDHEQHCAVLEAIMRGDATAADERMRGHLLDMRARLEADAPLLPGLRSRRLAASGVRGGPGPGTGEEMSRPARNDGQIRHLPADARAARLASM
jgi:GntR family transcriptional regulator, transcriptional repressor for pyruvate dehydrogenase complex